MPTETRIVAPALDDRNVRTADGQLIQVPEGWDLLPPGDAAPTRRVKAGGPSWTVQEKKGRRTFSRGVWAPADRIAVLQTALEAERSTESYAKRRQTDANRRERKQAEYVGDFHAAVVSFLVFATCHAELAQRLCLVSISGETACSSPSSLERRPSIQSSASASRR